jgi:hypothetical protein
MSMNYLFSVCWSRAEAILDPRAGEGMPTIGKDVCPGLCSSRRQARVMGLLMNGSITLQLHVAAVLLWHSSTAILSETYRISSELRSQATAGPVSTTVGDHVGIRGAVGSSFLPFWGLSFDCLFGRLFASVLRHF